MAAPAANHVHTWGLVLHWTPPSALAQNPLLDASKVPSIPRRECECGDAVWGALVHSAHVLAHLTPAAERAERRS